MMIVPPVFNVSQLWAPGDPVAVYVEAKVSICSYVDWEAVGQGFQLKGGPKARRPAHCRSAAGG